MAAMTENLPSVSTRSGYTDGTAFEPEMKVELVINDRAEAFIFHNKPFKRQISWLEYDLDTNKLDFVMNDGDQRNFGLLVKKDMSKYLQNSYQILMVLTDEKSGEPIEGEYFPLIIHRA
jgi:hypothetical protein